MEGPESQGSLFGPLEDVERKTFGPAPAQPLALRLRPRQLDEVVGQEHLVGEGRLLRKAIENDAITSVILWGPPGCGKTTLAFVIAEAAKAHVVRLSAVTAGLPELRQAIAEAKRRRAYGQQTILLIDEIHRFNKAQQDGLLPFVEDGTVILVGTTTENPYFEVNPALISRCRVFQLNPLGSVEIRTLLERALTDPERGYGDLPLQVDEEAVEHLVTVAGGDARKALTALEASVVATPASPDGAICITKAIAEDAVQRRALLYDKEGDVHYDTISAFIKSVRGSDPDAALFWLARMLKAGEDPRFIVRRMIILASEDIGNADPQALVVATAAAQALEWVGLPEAQFALAQATIYLATAPKSNSAMALFKAMEDVERWNEEGVPKHLRDSHYPAAAKLGHGVGYVYPHDQPGHHVHQQYLPNALQGRRYYQPGDQGYEQEIRRRLERWRGEEPKEQEESPSADGPSGGKTAEDKGDYFTP
ncbi:MAG: AAA family ATPase [Chloroflexi bacterium]|nr:AAA family ATPase [Chloroflexota bacterium]